VVSSIFLFQGVQAWATDNQMRGIVFLVYLCASGMYGLVYWNRGRKKTQEFAKAAKSADPESGVGERESVVS